MKLEYALAPIGRTVVGKRFFEYAYWMSRRLRERRLGNSHYEFLFTDVFGLDRSFYVGKRILDVGCGPRGSLEWADMAAGRMGVDPLAAAYQRLGARRHKTRYVSSPAERLPLPDGSFDVVSCINALDHVEDIAATISEMTRVAADDATLLLIVDVNHRPTHTEPHDLGWNITDQFVGWREVTRAEYEHTSHGFVASLGNAVRYDHGDRRDRWGILVSRFERHR